MAQKQELMASSLPASAANKLGLDALTTFAAAGSGQTSATQLTANCWNVTSGSGGVILQASVEMQFGVNNSGGSITVYPPIGSAINGGTTNAGITVPNTKGVILIPSGLNILANVSA